MQAVDYTTLVALCGELQTPWLPARIEQIYQRDRHTLSLSLRTLSQRGWLTLSWHPQGARVCLDTAPPRDPDTFTLSEQLRHQIKGLALVSLTPIQPWERVVQFAIAQRPGDEARYYLFLEVMGKYSNLVLTDAQQQIITVAHQVNAQQSRVRTVLTGQPYQLPPTQLATAPDPQEPFSEWQAQLALIPGTIAKQLLKVYRGVSPQVVRYLLNAAEIPETQDNQTLTPEQWEALFQAWQTWLNRLETQHFQSALTTKGFTVLAESPPPASDSPAVHEVIRDYYHQQLTRSQFQQLHHQLQQRLGMALKKLQQKQTTFEQRLAEAANDQQYQAYGDLLMAYQHLSQPGLTELTLNDFTTGEPVTIPLKPDKTLIQNAQAYYKQQQKLNRAQSAVEPLLAEVRSELAYLYQVETSLSSIARYETLADWQTLTEIREELLEEEYLPTASNRPRPRSEPEFTPHRRESPSGYPIWIGRNNRQNDHLSFRVATEYDLWFHSQEIAGSHVLLRLPPGAAAEETDIQCAADWAAFYSQGRGSEQIPVVYTQPKYVFKPKGSRPGMVIYQRETVVWGKPLRVLGS